MRTKPIPAFHHSKPDGFALVVNLTLMFLISVLVLGLLGLSSTALRRGSQDRARLEAQANARLALSLALGELQKLMGPDQRISANGGITPNTGVANQNLTGVWDSWIAGPLAAAPVNPAYPDAESHHQTIGNRPAGSMHPDYGNKNKHFRRWLLSLDPADAANPATPVSLALNGKSLPGKNETAVRLVGPGSLGTDAPADRFVSARLLNATPTSSTSGGSRHAWWVGDESQKARIMDDSYRANPAVTSADKIFRAQAPSSTGTTTIAGLTGLTSEQQARLGALPTLNTLDLVPGVQMINEGGAFHASQRNFHTVTTTARTLLTDVREGGLKRDLSTLLERPVNPNERSNEFMLYKFDVKDAWANDPAKYPTLPKPPQECVPIQDLAAFYQLYDQSRKAGIEYAADKIQVTTPDYGTPANYTTRFQEEYTTLYRNPVPIKVQFLLSLTADPITQADRDAMQGTIKVNQWIPATDTHKLRFAVIPAITMWNPYNVPIVMQSGDIRAQQITFKAPPLVIRKSKKRSDGTFYGFPNQAGSYFHFDFLISGGHQGRSDIIRLNFARTAPVVFQPCEVKVFSAPTNIPYLRYNSGGDASAQSMTLGKNLVDAVPGWNSDAILTLRNSFSIFGANTINRTVYSDNAANILMETP